ncbi:hypothetical protein NDU88_002410 [Pleurodeles waltl]|uniref:Secreted protein n=1 Tax=Pleurodeles waltl TaxID=8319 RepID=A0AAV7M392_PLEWA|nr:hypothetical protein NDU88_002410 [Pleurodeles waltl]
MQRRRRLLLLCLLRISNAVDEKTLLRDLVCDGTRLMTLLSSAPRVYSDRQRRIALHRPPFNLAVLACQESR